MPEIPDEMLDSVSGGLIFRNQHGMWEIIHDTNGDKLGQFKTLDEAEHFAKKVFGHSTRVIEWSELERLRSWDD